MDRAKLQFSTEEETLLLQADWLLTKNRILGKVDFFFGELADSLQQLFSATPHPALPPAILGTPKISRGEHYGGLPYRVLDFPRYFEQENVLAWRTVFWWGQFFSITVHLKGIYHLQFAPGLLESLHQASSSFCVSLSGDEWDHDCRKYVPLSDRPIMDWVKDLPRAPFCKITCYWPMENWPQVPAQMVGCYEEMWKGMFRH